MTEAPKNQSVSDIADKVAQVSDIYASRFAIERDDLWHLSKLTEELGELNAAYLSLKGRGRSRGKSDGELRETLEREFADMFAHLLLFARHCDVDVETAIRNKWYAHL